MGTWSLAAQNGLVRQWELPGRQLHHLALTGADELVQVPAGEGQRVYARTGLLVQACEVRQGCGAKLQLAELLLFRLTVVSSSR